MRYNECPKKEYLKYSKKSERGEFGLRSGCVPLKSFLCQHYCEYSHHENEINGIGNDGKHELKEKQICDVSMIV